MAIRQLTTFPDPVLKHRAQPVDDAGTVGGLISDLTDTMRSVGLVGIAAPQIGVSLRVSVTKVRNTAYREGPTDELRVFVNPKIVTASDHKLTLYEGCGSAVNIDEFGPVERPKIITVEAADADGRRFRLSADGLLGRVIQHEYDHLDGKGFTQRMADPTALVSGDWYKAHIKSDPEYRKRARITVRELTPLP